MNTDQDTDFSYMGDIAVSFNGCHLFSNNLSAEEEPSAVIAFTLSDKSVRFIKMTLKMASTLVAELSSSCIQLGIQDQRDELIELTLKSGLDLNFEINNNVHPIFKYIKHKPAMNMLSSSVYSSTPDQYAKFIHINAYTEFFKLDITFLNERTDRYTLPSSLIPLLIELLQNISIDPRS